MIGGAGSPFGLTPASRCVVAVLMVGLLVGCSESTRTARTGSDWWQLDDHPDELPQMLNSDLPFRYPWAEYARKVEGNVLLRLYVDTAGRVIPDSTRVKESSGNVALDAAAMKGASLLQFRPARRRGAAVAVSMLYPVHFRHPEGGQAPPARTDSNDRR